MTFIDHDFYQYGHNFRVDKEGNGDFPTLADAVAATVSISLTPGIITSSTPWTIEMNSGQYIEPLSAMNVPPFVRIHGIGGPGEDGGIASTAIIFFPVAADTFGITLEDGAALSNISIQSLANPANFVGDFNLIVCEGNARLSRCRVGLSVYSGANRARAIQGTGTSFKNLTIQRCNLVAGGTATTVVDSSQALRIFNTVFQTNTPAGTDGAVRVSGTLKSSIVNSRITVDSTLPNISFDVRNDGTGDLELTGTRAALNKRLGTGDIIDFHTTPQQLETSDRSVSVTKSAAYTIDAYEDGMIEVDTDLVTIKMPPIADAINGQSFNVKMIIAGTVTVDGDGVTIDGAATASLTTQYQSYRIQKNDRNTWSII